MRGVIGVLAIMSMLILASCSGGFDLQKIVDANPDKIVTVNKLSGNNAELYANSVMEFCQLDADTLYRVQISEQNRTITEIYDTDGNKLCELDSNDPEYIQKAVAVLVNDEPIYLSEINQRINSLPEQQRAENAGTIINSMIEEELLLQDADEQGVQISEEEINNAISSLDATAVSQIENVTFLKERIREQLKMQKLVSRLLEVTEINVDEQEMQSYYDENQDVFNIPQTWTLRQIQINIDDRGEESTRQRANTIMNLLNTTEFCSLVEQFTDDQTSVENCGRYTFAPGQMLPQVQQQVETMDPGEIKLVKSEMAYHIIELESVNAARQARYSEVQDQISNILTLQKRQEILNNYIQSLKDDSEIISYIG